MLSNPIFCMSLEDLGALPPDKNKNGGNNYDIKYNNGGNNRGNCRGYCLKI